MKSNNIDNTVDLSASFKLLNKIREIKDATILFKDLDTSYKIELKPNNKGIKFKLIHKPSILFLDKWSYKDLEIHHNDIKLKIPYLIFNNKTYGITYGKIPVFKYGHLNEVEPMYHRLVLPINNKLNFINSIENVFIKYKYSENNSAVFTTEATKANINNQDFFLYVAKENITKCSNRDYLVLESRKPITYNDFSEYCFSILISFGFISGDFINDDAYFLQYKSNKMTDVDSISYSQMRGSIKCNLVPVYSNPFAYIHNSQKADRYKDKIRKLNLDEFSKLCRLCHSNNDIKLVLLLLIEVHTQTLVSGPGSLSIALETLAKIIYEKNESAVAPIKSKRISKSLRKSLLKALNTYDEKDISAEARAIITKKINNINQRTNSGKLLVPFEILEISISATDKEAIEQRNAFLHGRTPMIKETAPETIDDSDKNRYYLFLKLYVLISSIILKYIGYDSLIVNYPKIYENRTGVKLNEEYYRQI